MNKTALLNKVFAYALKSTIHNELSPEQILALTAEQALIERMACLQEIEELRILLQNNCIDSASIPDWVKRSDEVFDKLLRYKLGEHGSTVKQGILIMPYSWRRKFRKIFAPMRK